MYFNFTQPLGLGSQKQQVYTDDKEKKKYAVNMDTVQFEYDTLVACFLQSQQPPLKYSYCRYDPAPIEDGSVQFHYT